MTSWIRNTLEVVMVEISPQVAGELLAMSRGNRKLRDSKVRKYTEQFRSGQHTVWSGPVISKTGRLLDWHHRLTALQKSGATITAPVTMGAEDRALEFMDSTEASRSGANKLEFLGEKNSYALSAALTIVNSYLNGQMAKGRTESPDEVGEFLRQHPRVRDSVSFCRGLTASRVTHTGDFIGLHYLFSKVDGDLANRFIVATNTGAGLEDGNPVLLLRRRLLETAPSAEDIRFRSSKRLNHVYRAALIIKAWEHLRTGYALKALRWRSTEAFPRISGIPVSW